MWLPWFCSALGIKEAWTEVDNVDRRHSLSVAEFHLKYEIPGKPVVITDVVKKWGAYKTWSKESLIKRTVGASFEAGPVRITMQDYFRYANSTSDERPLYIFDKHFADNDLNLAADYTVPDYFSDDLFRLLGSSRPDHRWLIVGPKRCAVRVWCLCACILRFC
jgi:hypothetical protein